MTHISFHDTLNALTNPVNRRILELLKNSRLPAGEISAAIEMTPAATSYHLNKLKKAGLVYESKHKNFIYYELNLSIFNEVVLWINSLKGEAHHETE